MRETSDWCESPVFDIFPRLNPRRRSRAAPAHAIPFRETMMLLRGALLPVLALLPLAALAACKGGTDSDDPEVTLQISAPRDSIRAIGYNLQLAATATDEDGGLMSTAGLLWESSNPAVATVTAGGLVTAVGTGSTVITATLDEATDTMTVHVTQVVKNVVIAPETDTIKVGHALQIDASARDSNNVVIPGVLTWLSSNPDIAEVSQTGLVVAKGVGRSAIAATTSTRAATAQVWVEWAGGTDTSAPQLGSVTIDPTTVSLANNFTITTRITASDAGSGVRFASVLLRLTGSNFGTTCTSANPSQGAGNSGTWLCSSTRAMMNQAGTYYVERVELTDFIGNQRIYTEAELAASGNRATVNVTP